MPVLASAQPQENISYAQPGHRYWRDTKTDIVHDMWLCAETDERGTPNGKQTFCMVTYNVAGINEEGRDEIADELDINPRWLTARDISKTCAWGPRTFGLREEDGIHKAKVTFAWDWLRENGNGYKEGNILNSEFRFGFDELRMIVRWGLFRQTRIFKEVPPAAITAPACVPPPIKGYPLPPPFVVVTPQPEQ